MIHSNGSVRPRPDNQVCSFHQYQYCTVTSSNLVRTSFSLVTFDIWSPRRRESAGRREEGGGSCSTSFVRGLLGPRLVAVSRSQRRYEQRGEKALSAAAGRLQQARLWKYTPGIIETFFCVLGLSAAEMPRGRGAAGEAKSFPTGGEGFGSFFLQEIHKLSTKTLWNMEERSI